MTSRPDLDTTVTDDHAVSGTSRSSARRGTSAEMDPGSRQVIVIGALLVFVVLGALTIIAGRGGFADFAAAPVSTESVGRSSETVFVEPGDTVWSIARQLQPSGDVRGLVDRIVALNGGPDLQAGQMLRLPD